MTKATIQNLVTDNRRISEQNKKIISDWEQTGIPQTNLMTPVIDEDNWASYDNTVITAPFQTPVDCSNTINGECVKDISLEDCKQLCKDDPLCDYGNYIKMNNTNYCLPLLNTIYPESDVFNGLWNSQNNYQTKNIKTSTFIDYNKYNPNNKFDYSLYFGDTIMIQNPHTQKYISIENNKVVSSNNGININLLFTTIIPSNAVKIRNYDFAIFNIPDSYLVIQTNIADNLTATTDLNWTVGFGQNTNKYQYIIIGCPYKSNNEELTYDDTFNLTINTKYIAQDNQNNIVLIDQKDKNNEAYNIDFKFIPMFNVSYCSAETITPEPNTHSKEIGFQNYCKVMTIDKAQRTSDGDFTINGSKIYRNLWCSSQCRDQITKNVDGYNFMSRSKNYKQHMLYDQLIISISSVVAIVILILILR